MHFGYQKIPLFIVRGEGLKPLPVRPQTFSTVVARGEVADESAGFVVDLRSIAENEFVFAFDSGVDLVDDGGKRFVAAYGCFAQGFEVGRGAGVSGGIGEIFVEGRGNVGREGNRSFADDEVIDVIAQGCGED